MPKTDAMPRTGAMPKTGATPKTDATPKTVEMPFELNVRIRLLDRGELAYGKGVNYLLVLCRRYHSLHRAAKEMQMSYRKALDIVKHAEECFGQPLLDRAGGRHGEDSEFTEFGSRLVERFSQIESDIDGYAEGQFRALLAYCNGAVETE